MKRLLVALAATSTLTACGPSDDSQRAVGEMASERIELTAEFNETILEILVAEGESVTAGQVLLRQDDEKAQATLAEVEAQLLQSKARFDELLRGPRGEKIEAARATLEGATQDFEFRQTEQQRVQNIYQRGLTSPDTLDKANAAFDAAQATLKLRLAQLEELLAGTTIEELAQAEQAVKQAAARRDRVQIDVDRHALKAPVDGVVDSRLFELGERPGAGQPMLVMLGGKQAYARVYVPELLRVHISAGVRAQILVDGLDTPITGRVRWVASESTFTPYFALTERDRGRLSFIAKIDISEIRERLPDGVPVEVEFELD
jgi:HlyD family secretion protein